MSLRDGVVCLNHRQYYNRKCADYQVRFFCPKMHTKCRKAADLDANTNFTAKYSVKWRRFMKKIADKEKSYYNKVYKVQEEEEGRSDVKG